MGGIGGIGGISDGVVAAVIIGMGLRVGGMAGMVLVGAINDGGRVGAEEGLEWCGEVVWWVRRRNWWGGVGRERQLRL